MIQAWIDTETTGLDPKTSAAFEIAVLVYQGGKIVGEELYFLNPLNDEIKWGEEAAKVNGVSEEEIYSFPPAEKIVPYIVELLDKYKPEEKLVFAGYNAPFDYSHLEALFRRYGYAIGDYFSGRLIDVLELVKDAGKEGLLPQTRDRKLDTMCKALGIEHGNAHTALSDIKATRRLYETIFRIQRSKR
jgi:DNA polymerase III epsilon subunit-like protein